MNKNFESSKNTRQRSDEIAAATLPPQKYYCSDDLLNAVSIKFVGPVMILTFENEALVIGDNGEKLFEISPNALKFLFGTKRRLYKQYIAEQINKFLEGYSGNTNRNTTAQ